jgi:hypothetical protein
MNEYVELKGGRMLEAPVTGGTGDFTLKQYILYILTLEGLCV